MNTYLQQTAEHFGVTVEALKSKSRKRELVEARACYSVLCHESGMTLQAIGDTINKNHATIIHYFRNVVPLPQVSYKLDYLREYVHNPSINTHKLLAHVEKRMEHRKKCFAE